MPQPGQVEQLSSDLRALYADSWARIQDDERDLLERWPGLTHGQRLIRLRDLKALVEALAATADEQALRFAADQLPRAFLLGAAASAAASNGGRLAGISLDALTHLAADTYQDLLAATDGVRASTKTLIRTLTRQHVSDLLVRGDTAVQTGRDLRQSLADRGITAVTYANGARHGLDDYADMVVRTKSALAYNEGGFAGLTAGGVTFVEVLDGASCGWSTHQDGDKANGTVRPLTAAQQQPLSHPRCRRAFAGRPDVRSRGAAEAAKPLTTSAQRADQAEVERLRELAFARRAAARALSGQVSRATAQLLDGSSPIASPTYARRVAARQVRMDREARLAARRARLARTTSRGTANGG